MIWSTTSQVQVLKHDFSCSFSDLPVKILGKTAAKTEKQFLVSDDIILVCELSRSNASVSWYKDNQLIDDTERYCSEEQGVFRSLVVLNAGLEDSGEYTCDAVDDKMVFYITVKGNHIIKHCKCYVFPFTPQENNAVSFMFRASGTDHWKLWPPGASYPGSWR